MAVLTPQQRNMLESAVKQARKLAELGAFNALHSMAVDHNEPFAHMTPQQRNLRNSLRSKARLLGDELPANGAQKIIHLSYELAYETWHKMLFAKFLEANSLLMHTDGVAVTMEDCEEFADEEGFVDKWDAAANYASKMLPAIFRTDDPLMGVTYATDERIKLETIIDGLENQIFVADDALGWVYQFWQSEAKAAINTSGDKIDGEKLPAVTQLFTEPYMVHFLIDNTLGAWWVSRNPGLKPPVKFEYLRLQDDGSPAAGKFEGWPDKTAGVTSLDPCMGSGHFVASLFPVFAALRMHEEGLTKEQATDKVISENLHGLELDARCTQIAAFNLALTAWKFCGHYKELPEMNLACSGIAPKGKVEDWVKLVSKETDANTRYRMENGMRELYNHFQLAPELGSLLDPTTIKASLETANFQELQPVLRKALENEADAEQLERGVMAAGIAKAGQLLTKKYTLQITNVPYLGKGKFDKVLSDYVLKYYADAKADLATVFFERLFKTAMPHGTVTTVIPHNWLFLTPYKKYREKLLRNETWNLVARLGAGAFSQISGEVVKAVLISLSHKKPSAEQLMFGIDVSDAPNANAKDEALKFDELKSVKQISQFGNPDYRIVFSSKSELSLLSKYSYHNLGICTGDSIRFYRKFWEVINFKGVWDYIQGTVENNCDFGGLDSLVKWEDGNGELYEFVELKLGEDKVGSWLRGRNAWGEKGVLVNAMSQFTGQYLGGLFDENTIVVIPSTNEYLLPVWCYCSDEIFKTEVRKTNQAIKVRGDIIKIPFELEHWQKVASEKYPNGLPKPYTDDPTQWLFHGHPIKTENPLQVALTNVLGYRWPAESDSEMVLADEAKVLIEAGKAFDQLTDEDGIFCIPSVNAEQAGAERLRDYLQQVFAGEWNNQTITQLLQKEGAKSTNLEAWLRDEFFVQHSKVFQNRPFIWHIWDGRKDGFSVLVNYHKLDKDNLSKLIYTYLGDWIRICEAKKKAGESGAEGLLSAAQKLKANLEAILQGEDPYDIFVRWKPLEQQPIGWEPELNDGVRLNIRPFVEAGVLRSKFNLKWGVDRGKNPPGTSWGEERNNDNHLSLEKKLAAREKAKK
jgi:hypothetical protein